MGAEGFCMLSACGVKCGDSASVLSFNIVVSQTPVSVFLYSYVQCSV